MGLQEVSSGFLRLWVVCIHSNVRQTQSTIQKSYIHEFSPDHASFQSIRMLSSSSSLLTACCSCSKSSNLSTIYKIKDIVLSLFLPLDAMSCLKLTTLAFSSSFNWLVILLFSSLILAWVFILTSSWDVVDGGICYEFLRLLPLQHLPGNLAGESLYLPHPPRFPLLRLVHIASLGLSTRVLQLPFQSVHLSQRSSSDKQRVIVLKERRYQHY